MPLDLDRTHRWAVVLAGGDGTRLQELTQRISGDSRPKQFCEFFGGKTLLDHTRERIVPLFDEQRTLFALARAHEPFYRDQLPEVDDWRKIVQPANRGTAVAMALCLQSIAQQDDEAMVAFFPSDHHYSNSAAFRDSVECGLGLMAEYPQSILVVGAEARYPEVEYGWIEPGRTLVEALANPLLRVSRFWEKPTLRCAELLHRRGYMWNTFVTIGLAGAFLDLLRASVPEVTRSLQTVGSDHDLDQLYGKIASIDFSRAVLAKLPERLVVLRDSASGWTDFGSPGRVTEVITRHGMRPAWFDSTTLRNDAWPARVRYGS